MELFILWIHSDSRDGEVRVVGVVQSQGCICHGRNSILRKLPKGFRQSNCEIVFVNQKESRSHFVVDHLGKEWCTILAQGERVQAGTLQGEPIGEAKL